MPPYLPLWRWNWQPLGRLYKVSVTPFITEYGFTRHLGIYVAHGKLTVYQSTHCFQYKTYPECQVLCTLFITFFPSGVMTSFSWKLSSFCRLPQNISFLVSQHEAKHAKNVYFDFGLWFTGCRFVRKCREIIFQTNNTKQLVNGYTQIDGNDGN